jgi:hypothetical protein
MRATKRAANKRLLTLSGCLPPPTIDHALR